MRLPDWSDLCGHLRCSALQNSWPGCGVEGLVLHWNHPDFMAFVCCLFSMSIVLGFIDCASTDPVIQSNQRPHLYMFFSQWPRCNMFHFCMDIRLRLFSSHYMVPRSLGQRTIYIYIYWISVVWIVFKLFARVIKLIFRSNMIEHKFKFHMPAEGRTRPGKSIYLAQTGKTHSCRRTWMWLQGGFEQSLLEKVGIFWPHGPWHRFKNQRKGSRKRSRKRSRKKKETKEGRTKERRREKNMKLYELM